MHPPDSGLVGDGGVEMQERTRRYQRFEGLLDSERPIEATTRRPLSSDRAHVHATKLALTVVVIIALAQGFGSAKQSLPDTHKASLEEARKAHATRLTSVSAGRPAPVYGQIRARAMASRNNAAATVPEFVDEIFRQTGFDGAASSLRRRVAKAELAYRQGCHPAIELLEFVRGMNATAGTLNLPTFFKTSISQVRLQQLYASVLAPGTWDEGEGKAMAPSEAVFVALFLTYQKVWNGAYQVDPDRWASQQRTLMANRPDPAFLRLQRRPPIGSDLGREYIYLRSELGRENSDVTRTAHDLLDRFGIAR
jgi:hypothetical protein